MNELTQLQVTEIIAHMRQQGTESVRQKQAHFAIDSNFNLGLTMPQVKEIAKRYKKNHELALALWHTNIHEARLLATLIADPKKTDLVMIQSWHKDLNSWDLVDGFCSNLLRKTNFASDLIHEWAATSGEYQKRAAFSLLAYLAVHDKKANDAYFISYFELIKLHAFDERNFVKKAVNWSIRQIGKRNQKLCKRCIALCYELQKFDDKAAKWVSKNALQELESYLATGKIKSIGGNA